MNLPTSGLVTLKENKLLLAFSKNKEAWYLPGGKMDAGETAQEALIREIKEELSITLHADRLQYLLHVTAHAYGEIEDVIMQQECFLYQLDEKVQPSHEIGAVKYVSYQEYLQEPIQVVGVIKVFDYLVEEGYIVANS